MSAKLQRVWLILVKVRIIGENPAGLAIGSESLVQCFIPERAMERALSLTDGLLQSEGMCRMDVVSCSSFDRAEDEADSPDFLKRDILQARSSGKPLTGTFFTSPESASFEAAEEASDDA